MTARNSELENNDRRSGETGESSHRQEMLRTLGRVAVANATQPVREEAKAE